MTKTIAALWVLALISFSGIMYCMWMLEYGL